MLKGTYQKYASHIGSSYLLFTVSLGLPVFCLPLSAFRIKVNLMLLKELESFPSFSGLRKTLNTQKNFKSIWIWFGERLERFLTSDFIFKTL